MKRWWKSKTLRFNAIVAAFTALEASTGLLQPHLPFNLYFALCIFVPVINAVLRCITSTSVK